ncbi:hypothetical protein L873DRAFT_1069256 [Choiromyces venosus 120613-1]|uniref:Uncharacterized protein n=1 Tax=Choiromyces venosus 120613-1 TaxID=1336337 RepID=A0A3N4K3N7_9PEZI|nr:hypothetical protein L873DRAFT_1069256 [Choiromyces venosus 120613-1]
MTEMSESVFLCLRLQLVEFDQLTHFSFRSLCDQWITQYAILFSFVSSPLFYSICDTVFSDSHSVWLFLCTNSGSSWPFPMDNHALQSFRFSLRQTLSPEHGTIDSRIHNKLVGASSYDNGKIPSCHAQSLRHKW